ncbi:C1 family peptidase [Pseudomonas peli]|uniref:C1 family peptidase n=1 Tax=Pseudomonas peli TaxID=592361 RepID=UPI0035B54ED8
MDARDQGTRGSCVAFSLAGIQGFLARHSLSPEYAYLATVHQSPGWQPNQGLDVRVAIAATRTGLPEESAFPYQPDEPSHPLPALPIGMSLYGKALSYMPVDLSKIKGWLQSGRPVGVLIALTPTFVNPSAGIVLFDTQVYQGRHAVVIVGHGTDSAGVDHYLVCNSWGVSWGVEGHAWVPECYITTHASIIYGVS